MTDRQTFAFRYGAFRDLLSILGFGPRFARIDWDGTSLLVQFGWGFRATIPRSSIRSAHSYLGVVTGIGVHGFRGRWLVNGAASGLVEIRIAPPARALVMFIPVRLETLRVSLEDPDGLLAVLSA